MPVFVCECSDQFFLTQRFEHMARDKQSRAKGAEEAEELTQAIHRLRGSIGNLNREGRIRLLEAFERVNDHFRSLFTTLFEGGQAHLELV